MWTKFIEDVFIVNLLERPDRLESANKESEKFDLGGIVWAAEKNEDGRQGLKNTMSSFFEMCLYMEYEKVLVLEDDFKIICPGFNTILDNCVSQLPEDFDLFYLGGNIPGIVKRYSEHLITTPAIYATHAVVYSKQAIEKILPLLNERGAYDEILVNRIQKDKKTYCAYPMLVTQRNGYSDIEKKEVQYNKYLEDRFKEKTRNL